MKAGVSVLGARLSGVRARLFIKFTSKSISHLSSLISHLSSLISHFSSLTTHHSLLTTHHSLLTTPHTLPTPFTPMGVAVKRPVHRAYNTLTPFFSKFPDTRARQKQSAPLRKKNSFKFGFSRKLYYLCTVILKRVTSKGVLNCT